MSLKVIGIGGLAGSGKTTICFDLIHYQRSHKLWKGDLPLSYEDKTNLIAIRPLAYELKTTICRTFNLNMIEMEKDKNQKTGLTNPITGETDITYRNLLQYYGTEIFRKTDPDIWVRLLDKWAKKERMRFIFISDIRFMNEVEYCKKNGLFVYLKGRGVVGDTHASETLDGEKIADIIIDNRNLSRQDQLQLLAEKLDERNIIFRL